MPITHIRYDAAGKVIETLNLFKGRVIKIRKFDATRNHSDTLDYSDFRNTECTEALVYIGRVYDKDAADEYWASAKVDEEVELERRFKWVDCTNIFVWRGTPERKPEVDPTWLPQLIPGFLEDYEAWHALMDQRREEAEKKRQERELQDAEHKRIQEQNRPVVGKQMRVARGRKVPVGTVGTVAFISGSGSVLLKDDAVWRDRTSQGRWVDGSYLVAR